MLKSSFFQMDLQLLKALLKCVPYFYLIFCFRPLQVKIDKEMGDGFVFFAGA
jgi:hypothetical protein